MTEFSNLQILPQKRAIQATENSINNTSTLKEKVAQKIDTLNKLVTEINKLFNTYPLESETRNRISRGKMLLAGSRNKFFKGRFLQANRRITDSEYLLTSSYESASDNLKNYFKSYSVMEELG